MKTLNYKHFSFFFLLILIVFAGYSLPAVAHEGQTHTILETSEEHKQKIQECLALPNFQDSCYIELCGEEGTYLCTENILDAVVEIADPQKAMDVLNGIMQSDLFAIQTNGHLLSHIIGNAIAHYYGFTGESMLLCPEGFNWGCTHGFFEDVLKEHNDPVQAGIEICESLPNRPTHRKAFCYHGIGHIFMFNESYDVMKSLSFCDLIPLPEYQDSCYQGVLMENQEYVFVETPHTIDGWILDENRKEAQGYRDDDFLAPCNRLEGKYRPQCYAMHGYYLLYRHNFSVKDASYYCLNDKEYAPDCITGVSILVAATSWQPILMELNPMKPYRETTFIENVAYLCGMIPHEYIETCHSTGIGHLMTYKYFQDVIDFCLLYSADTRRCFGYMGRTFYSSAVSDTDFLRNCEVVPEEFRGDCIEGGLFGLSHSNMGQATHNQHSIDRENEKESLNALFYLFITLGCILLITPLAYYNRTLLKKIMKV